jgi:cytochrome P450
MTVLGGRGTAAAVWPIPLDDPYPAYRELRASGPIHWFSEIDRHLIVSYAQAHDILRSPRWSCEAQAGSPPARRPERRPASPELLAAGLLFIDPPRHTWLRKGISPYLSPSAVELLRPRIRAIVGAALAGWPHDREQDVMSELAYPVPLAVICELLDTGTQTAITVRRETPRLVGLIDPLADQKTVDDAMSSAIALVLELVPLVADRLAHPSSDLLSRLVTGSAEVPGLDVTEAIVMALLLLAAGHETTASLIGNALVTFQAQPDKARQLRDRPELIPAAVEELIRLESPVQLTARTARHDTAVGAVTVAAGEQVLVCLGAANRDPSVFSDPDQADFERAPEPHLGFGHGPHFCAGATLARAEAQEILRGLLSLRPPVENCAMTVERGSSPALRQITKLRLTPA